MLSYLSPEARVPQDHPARTTAEVNRRAAQLIQAQPHPVHTITTDNGTEVHGYAAVEAQLANHASPANRGQAA